MSLESIRNLSRKFHPNHKCQLWGGARGKVRGSAKSCLGPGNVCRKLCPNISSRCGDISLDNETFGITGGTTGNVWGSPESIGVRNVSVKINGNATSS